MKVLRWKEVQERVGLSRSTVWRLEKKGLFPKRFSISLNSIGWIEQEIENFINTRLSSGRNRNEIHA